MVDGIIVLCCLALVKMACSLATMRVQECVSIDAVLLISNSEVVIETRLKLTYEVDL